MSMMKRVSHEYVLNSVGWMYEIIANKRNSLDVDKLDYLQRDAKHLGLSSVSF